jgi:acetate kinase
MPQLVLSINAGSSSLKCSLCRAFHDANDLKLLAKAEISAINQPPATLKYSRNEEKNTSELGDVKDHKQAFEYVLKAFLLDDQVDLRSKDDIDYACHRVVQGGGFTKNQLITKETFHKIEALSDLASLYADTQLYSTNTSTATDRVSDTMHLLLSS